MPCTLLDTGHIVTAQSLHSSGRRQQSKKYGGCQMQTSAMEKNEVEKETKECRVAAKGSLGQPRG